MLKPIVLLTLMLLCLSSCKTVSVNQESLKTTEHTVVLSSIGLEKDNLIQTGFKNTAIPKYKTPIKVAVMPVVFSKSSFKAFTEAAKTQGQNISLIYADSLADKPKFISVQIADRVALMSELNAKHNADVKTYLSGKNEATVVTNISMVLKPQDRIAILQADEVFLVQNGIKSYVLELYTSDKSTQTINFNDGVVFAYKLSNCCWQENDRQQLQIVDLVEGYRNCPNKTYKSAKRAKRKVNYFKL